MLIYGHDRALARWASARLSFQSFREPYVAIGVAHNDQIVAVALYGEYRWPNIEITFVTSSPRWASHGAIDAILRYPFKQLGCKRVTAIIEAKNQSARTFLCRLGFVQEGYHEDALPTGDAISYRLSAKDAEKWITEENHGKVVTLSASAS